MSSSNVNSIIAVVPVTDHARSVSWYKMLLGRDADVVPVEGVAEWMLTENAWLQVATDPDRAGCTTVIVGVDDIEAQHRSCAEANVPLGEVIEYPEIIKMSEVIDPDGNKVAFVQDISDGVATAG